MRKTLGTRKYVSSWGHGKGRILAHITCEEKVEREGGEPKKAVSKTLEEKRVKKVHEDIHGL